MQKPAAQLFSSLSFFLLGMVGVSISTKVCHKHWAPCLWESETMLGVTRKLCVPGNPSISSVPVPLLFFPLWILLMVSRSLFWDQTICVATRKHHQNGEVKESSSLFSSVQLDCKSGLQQQKHLITVQVQFNCIQTVVTLTLKSSNAENKICRFFNILNCEFITKRAILITRCQLVQLCDSCIDFLQIVLSLLSSLDQRECRT